MSSMFGARRNASWSASSMMAHKVSKFRKKLRREKRVKSKMGRLFGGKCY